jgi:sugar-specific transcriptional regulator TrmB
MDADSLLQTIRQLGFSEYEARCYLALFNKDSMAVSEIAKISKVPRPNAYDALEKLMTNGFIVAVPGKTKCFSVSDPRLIKEKSFLPMINSIEYEIELLDRKRKEKAATKTALEENISGALEQLNSLYRHNRGNGNPLDYIEVLKNSEQIHRRHIQLCAEAKSELLGFSKPPFASGVLKLRKEQDETLLAAVKRGVTLRAIHELPAADADRQNMYKDIKKSYNPRLEEARLIEKLPMKANVYDGLITMIVLEYPILGDLALTGLIVNHKAYSEGFKKLFETYWNEGIDYYILNNRKYYLSKDKALLDKG